MSYALATPVTPLRTSTAPPETVVLKLYPAPMLSTPPLLMFVLLTAPPNTYSAVSYTHLTLPTTPYV